VKREGEISMALFNADKQFPHYAVFFNGRPLAEISLKDQDRPQEIKQAFVSDDYAKHVVETCTSMGAKETLDALHAKYYVGVTTKGELAQRAASMAEAKLEAAYAERLAALKENFLNTVNLAIAASNKGSKGLFVENNLKVALKDSIRRAGVANPAPVIDEVWMKQASAYFDAVLSKAEEWMGYSPEAMHEVTKEILGSAGVEEEEEPKDMTVEEAQNSVAESAAKGIRNVPIVTASAQEHESTDLKSYYRGVMKFNSRLSSRLGGSR
jgi:aminopeptidase N